VREIFTLEEYHQLVLADPDGPRVIVTSMASFEMGFSRKLVKEIISKPKNEILFIQAMHVFSHDKKTLAQQLLIDGEKEIVLPEECQVMGILDDSGENYIGA